MIIDTTLLELVKQIKQLAIANKITISTAESCTGGLLASCLTSVEGASDYFSYGFVTYSNQAKINLLNIAPNIIQKFGAVSEETAQLMALGCKEKSKATIAVAITGIAGPSGGSIIKPIGTVWFAIASDNNVASYLSKFDSAKNKVQDLDNRQIIRYLACQKALQLILRSLINL
jgi:nicotinamide-nucleotide amidase